MQEPVGVASIILKARTNRLHRKK